MTACLVLAAVSATMDDQARLKVAVRLVVLSAAWVAETPSGVPHPAIPVRTPLMASNHRPRNSSLVLPVIPILFERSVTREVFPVGLLLVFPVALARLRIRMLDFHRPKASKVALDHTHRSMRKADTILLEVLEASMHSIKDPPMEEDSVVVMVTTADTGAEDGVETTAITESMTLEYGMWT